MKKQNGSVKATARFNPGRSTRAPSDQKKCGAETTRFKSFRDWRMVSRMKLSPFGCPRAEVEMASSPVSGRASRLLCLGNREIYHLRLHAHAYTHTHAHTRDTHTHSLHEHIFFFFFFYDVRFGLCFALLEEGGLESSWPRRMSRWLQCLEAGRK